MNKSDHGVVHCNYCPFRAMKNMALSDQAVKIRDVPNAGGNSVISEVMSFELLKRCFGAQLLKVGSIIQCSIVIIFINILRATAKSGKFI